jgi:small subunit ribosomal protein S1
VTARILDVNPKERRIRLSIKAAQEEEERKNRRGRGEERRNREAKAQEAEFQNTEPSVTIGELIKGQLPE